MRPKAKSRVKPELKRQLMPFWKKSDPTHEQSHYQKPKGETPLQIHLSGVILNKLAIIKAICVRTMFFALVFSEGCATVITHHGPGSEDFGDLPYGVYRGARFDGKGIVSKYSETPEFFRVFCILDFPPSAVEDTLLLPYDLTTVGPGSLKVTVVLEKVEPSGHISYVIGRGGQWQVDGGAWQNNGTIVSGLKPGPHHVSFSRVNGCQNPDSEEVDISPKQLATVTGTYKSSFFQDDVHTQAPH
jgi:uncharacterized protein YceK